MKKNLLQEWAVLAKELDSLDYAYLIVMKLEASRMQTIADIGRMLKYTDESTRFRVREVVKKYQPQDLEDLEQIIQIEESI